MYFSFCDNGFPRVFSIRTPTFASLLIKINSFWIDSSACFIEASAIPGINPSPIQQLVAGTNVFARHPSLQFSVVLGPRNPSSFPFQIVAEYTTRMWWILRHKKRNRISCHHISPPLAHKRKSDLDNVFKNNPGKEWAERYRECRSSPRCYN